MGGNFLIGIDIGTQGTKTALFTLGGECLARAFRPSKLHRPKKDAVEENPEAQVESVCSGIRSCLSDAKAAPDDVLALAIAGQMAGVIGVGANGRNVTPYDSWLDTRCAPQIRQMENIAGGEITRKTGGPPSFNHGPKILRWKNEFPKKYRAIAAFVQPGGYAAMRLCGLDAKNAFIDSTYLHFSGFADNRKAAWDPPLCATFGVAMEKLPRILPPHETVGGISRTMAQKCGLRAGTTVIAGCGDTSASFLACGATREGLCIDVAGTASVFAATTTRFVSDIKTRTLSCGRSVSPGLWHIYAYVNGGGMNLEWLRKSVLGGTDFEKLNALAEAVALSDDLPMFVPHLGGRVNPSWPELRGAWAGLAWAHGPGELYRALLEGVALEYGIYRDILLSLDPKFQIKELRVTGGGARSRIWNRIKAGVLGCPVRQIASSEGAPTGAALLAGFGAGAFGDLHAASQRWIKPGGTFKPSLRDKQFSTRRLARYRALLKSLNSWTHS